LSDRLVLVADDDNDIRDMIAFSLGSAGFRTVSAKDGNTAARIATVAGIDAIVTDVRMPALNGYELCQLVRTNPHLRGVPVLMISALHSAEDIRAGMSAGATAYLPKPLSPRELVSLLRRHLSGADPA
jgi:two-component system response regulator MtrA